MSTPTARLERARPLLGTIVRLRVDAADERLAHDAAGAAFAEIARIHRLMSFQEEGSDVSALNRAVAGQSVAVDASTAACLRLALRLAAETEGAFDPAAARGGEGSWRDIAVEGSKVRLVRSLNLDLSGIAKGYAVDRACAALRAHGVRSASVNAGGDLRVFGPAPETVALQAGAIDERAMINLRAGAIASSSPAVARDEFGGQQHWDGRTRAAPPDAFVSVVAPRCTTADALTKIVLALGEEAAPILKAYGAIAYVHRADRGWTTIGGCEIGRA